MLQREALKLDQKLHGNEDPRVVRDLSALAQLLRAQVCCWLSVMNAMVIDVKITRTIGKP